MKKLILLFFFIPVFVNGNPIPVNAASKIASHYGIVRNLAYKDTIGDTVLFYVFNLNPKGFVIISGDNGAQPVIAYSLDNNFKLIPHSGITDYLGNAEKSMKDIIRNKRSYIQKASSRSSTVIPPLIQTSWNQAPYYNEDCPDGSVTGCVATCMGQTMYYWGVPIKGTGTYYYNAPPYGILSQNFDTAYQWNLMSKNITSSTPQDSINPIAFLLYQLGVSVAMEYSPSESGAYVFLPAPSAQYSYTTYFGYNSNTINGLQQTDYSNHSWDSIVYSELEADRPINYVGFGSQGGHVWVLDGVDIDSLYHMNWGWGGQNNGYYSLSYLNPGGTPLSSDNGMLIGIEPAIIYSCSEPINLHSLKTTDSTILLGWDNTDSASSFTVQYQQIGSYNWIDSPDVKEPFLISNLLSGSQYQFQVQKNCSNTGKSYFTYLDTITTSGVQECGTPITNPVWASSYQAIITWGSVVDAVSYTLKYKLQGTDEWTIINNISTTFDTVKNLLPSSAYFFSVNATCTSGDTSIGSFYKNETFTQFFTFPPCPVATNGQTDSVGYSTARASVDSVPDVDEYIFHYHCYSNCGGVGDVDVGDIIDTSNICYFDEICEGNFWWTCTPVCDNGGAAFGQKYYFSTTDTEFCPIPINLSASNITDSSYILKWIETYRPQYCDYLISVNNGNFYYYPDTNYLYINGQSPGETNTYSVQAFSSKYGRSGFSVPISVTTLVAHIDTVCDTIKGLTISNIEDSSAVVSWNEIEDDTMYYIQWQTQVETQFHYTANTTDTSFEITGLSPGTPYKAAVTARCEYNDNFEIWVWSSFITSISAISLSPNPTNETIDITYPLNYNFKSLDIRNSFGEPIRKYLLEPNSVSLSGYRSGIYFFQFRNAENKLTSEKVTLIKN